MFKIYEGICRPETLPQFFAGDEVSWTNQESTQNLERLALDLEQTAIAAQLPSAQVSLKLSEADNFRIRSGLVLQHIRAIYEQELKRPHLAITSAPYSHSPLRPFSSTPRGSIGLPPKMGGGPHNASFQAVRSAQEC